jgi:hypothetical protein
VVELMPNKLQKYITTKSVEITGTMWCSHCQHSRPKEGGVWKTLTDGKRRRWKCATCTENQRQRMAERAGSSEQ